MIEIIIDDEVLVFKTISDMIKYYDKKNRAKH